MKTLTAPSFANFSEYDLIKALLLISDSPLGRNQLMKKLELTEASTRSLMKKLAAAKFVKTTTKGISLNKEGQSFVGKIKSVLAGPAPINFGGFSIAFRISNSASMINFGLEQRDAAIRAGAAGCLVLVYRGNKLILPGGEGMENVYIDIFNGVSQNFKLVEGDAVIVAFANTKRQAELGAWAAAKTLLLAKNI